MVAITGNERGVYSPKIKQSKVKHVWLERELKDWFWQLCDDKTVVLFDKRKIDLVVLDKVRLMSFLKFAVSALDKMRIEDNKKLRIQIRKTKDGYKQRIDILRNKKRQQRSLFVKARKIK